MKSKDRQKRSESYNDVTLRGNTARVNQWYTYEWHTIGYPTPRHVGTFLQSKEIVFSRIYQRPWRFLKSALPCCRFFSFAYRRRKRRIF